MIPSVTTKSYLNTYSQPTSYRNATSNNQGVNNQAQPHLETDIFSAYRDNSAGIYCPGSAAKTASAQKTSIVSADDRKTTAKNYNEILDELRKQYSESEAMRRFDGIMRADGYELVPNQAVGPEVSANCSNRINGISQGPVSLYGNTDKSIITGLANGVERDREANLVMQSNIWGTLINGKPEVSTESWAIFGAIRPLSSDLQGYWQGRHLDSAKANTDIALEEYMANLPDSSQRSAVAVNSDIGNIVSNLLKENGIELESGQYLDLELSNDFGIMVHSDSKHDLYSIFNKSPELLGAMKAQAQMPPPENVSHLPGSYEEDGRSVSYTFNRYFTYSADEPSAVVMNDFLGVVGHGYTYAKKAGDYFDPAAESFNTGQQIPVANAFMQDEDEFHRKVSAVNDAVNQNIASAASTGEPVQGTVSRAAIEKAKILAQADAAAFWSNTPMYELGYGPATSTLVEPKTGELEEKQPLPEPLDADSSLASIVETKNAALRNVIELLRAKQATILSQSSIITKLI